MKIFMNAFLRGWKHHFWTQLATTLVLALSTSVLCGLWLSSKNLSAVMTAWGEDIQLTVYLADSSTETQRVAVENFLKSETSVSDVKFQTKEANTEVFKQSLASYGSQFLKAVSDEGSGPFPASFSVALKPEFRTPQNIEQVASKVQKLEGIEDVTYGEEWIHNYSIFMKLSGWVTVVLALALTLGSVFTVSNSIRASLASRQKEIAILELIGATQREIRVPFFLEGMSQGFLASGFSLVLLGGVFFFLKQGMAGQVQATSLGESIQFFKLYQILIIFIGGGLIGGLGSYLCVARLNTGWLARDAAG